MGQMMVDPERLDIDRIGNKFDLNRHTLIEASAGTGKTYTIERIFIKLITEKKLRIENILIVTYTEKAAGELKQRIKAKIESEINNSNNNKDKLINALNNFDKVEIHTIHGFCYSIINDYSFENKLFFSNKLVDDYDIYRKILKDIMRSSWKGEFKDNLTDLLIISGIDSRWEETVIKLSMVYNLEEGIEDRIIPEFNSDIILTISEFIKKSQSLKENRYLLSFFKNNKIREYLIDSGEYQSINSIDKFIRVIELIRLFFLSNGKLSDLGYLLFNINKEKIKCGYLTSKYKKGQTPSEPIILIDNLLTEIITMIEDYIILQNQLKVNTVYQLKKLSYEHKRKNAQISFDDMLNIVYKTLYNEDNTLLKTLRKRFSAAIIDEFQDTDMVQWRIFYRLFMENTSSNTLFLVGDPKQAIYGFRGADIYAYYRAREDIVEKFSGNYFYLDTNWRSTPSIVAGFNEMFNKNIDNYWFANSDSDKFRLDYKHSLSPSSHSVMIENIDERLFVNGIDLGSDIKSDEARRRFACFTATEINRVLSYKIEVITKDKEKKQLKYSDFCVLVQNRKEARFIEEAFRNARIPYSYYKKDGLYQSVEALELLYILEALSEFDNKSNFRKALLTRFFSIKIEDICLNPDGQDTNIFERYFEDWSIIAQKRDWAILFNSLFYESGLFKRLLLKTKGERAIANFLQISKQLSDKAYNEDFSIKDLTNNLHSRINFKEEDDQSSDIHTIETDDESVKIMTLHASKGLEFSIVYIAGGFSEIKTRDWFKFFDGESTCYDLIKSEKNKNNNLNNRKAELERLFYVGFTRAIYRLYIPLLTKTPSKSSLEANKFISPVISLFTEAFNKININTAIYKKIAYDCNQPLKITDEKQDNQLNDVNSKSVVTNIFNFDINSIKEVVKNRSRIISSFSSEVRYNKTSVLKASPKFFGEDDTGNENEFYDIDDNIFDIQNKFELPSSAETGNLFHSIMEQIDFKEFNKGEYDHSSIDTLIKIYCAKVFRYKKNFDFETVRDSLFEIIKKTINKDLGNGLRLTIIENNELAKEQKFYYKSNTEDTVEVSRFMTGSIDLIFKWKEKYYIVDWKTNKLSSYKPEDMSNEINKKNYNLQYTIYNKALLKHIKNRAGNSANIGGIFYLFVRGINEKNNDGIFFTTIE